MRGSLRRMRMIRSALLILLVAGPALAQQAVPQIAAGTPYGKAREELLRQGWQPLVLPDRDLCMRGDRRCEGRPEMTACAGTGMANCAFAWQRRGLAIDVFTMGEDATVSGVARR